jgi:hypothetical protein
MIIPDVVLIQLSSWGWAHSCSKHVEDSNKHIIEETVHQIGHLPELYEDARSEKYKTAAVTLNVTKLKLSLFMSRRHMGERKYTSTHSYSQQYMKFYCCVKRSSCPLNRRLGGANGRYGRFGEEVSLCLTWMDPNFPHLFSPHTRHYTNWVINAQL